MPVTCPRCSGRVFESKGERGTVEYECISCGYAGETRVPGQEEAMDWKRRRRPQHKGVNL